MAEHKWNVGDVGWVHDYRTGWVHVTVTWAGRRWCQVNHVSWHKFDRDTGAAQDTVGSPPSLHTEAEHNMMVARSKASDHLHSKLPNAISGCTLYTLLSEFNQFVDEWLLKVKAAKEKT